MPPAADCGNPLLLKWLEEWVVEAQERGYKSLPTLKKARDSMKACPMRFDHPSEAVCLNGLGEGLAKRLTDSLEKYCDEMGIAMPKKPRGKKRKSVAAGGLDNGDDPASPSPSPKKARKTKTYVPKLRSGAYAIMLALGTQQRNSRIGITKEEIIAFAEPYSDHSFTQTRPSEFFTAWNSMKTLINKDLVYTKKNPATRYYLTDEGWDLADTIKASGDPTLGRAHDFQPAVPGPSSTTTGSQDVESDSEPEEIDPETRAQPQANPNIPDIPEGDTVSIPTFEPIILRPGTFTVELILDNREVVSKKDRDGIPNQLTDMGVPHSVRALPLGDFLWVARVREDKAKWLNLGKSNLIMLDYIMERKRLDDLIASLRDGRYEEQKFRLKRSSITNVKYLIENKKIDADIMDKWGDGITTSIAKMMIQDGINVKQTLDLGESLRYIERMTKLLKKQYEGNPLYIIPTTALTVKNYSPLMQHLRSTQPDREYSITFDAFEGLSSKSQNLTLKDVYLKMLMRTKSVSAVKAIEIQKRWPTPRAFLEAFENLDGGGAANERGAASVGAGGAGNGMGMGMGMGISKEKSKNKGKGPAIILDPDELIKKRKREMVSKEIGTLIGNKKVQGALSAKIAEVWGGVV
ncbi:a8c3b8af-e3d0-49e4-8065-2a2dcdea57bf-CDS [Sclerotinia trifoliorum]|uniref:Crossover junction endonuclease MUS81 n=1 Tax=Sclerotinia trifoliorum TaxID=28548 RepID=A0A8H2ZNF4_9HELO|nr:a8c3b8af-e3d0-49e4-8065-2a2dcdea57bf-CDS [Sclerotinia trifoliorum]